MVFVFPAALVSVLVQSVTGATVQLHKVLLIIKSLISYCVMMVTHSIFDDIVKLYAK